MGWCHAEENEGVGYTSRRGVVLGRHLKEHPEGMEPVKGSRTEGLGTEGTARAKA